MSVTEFIPADVPPTATVRIRPWPDEVVELIGHDPRSLYVERFWLGILGPSTTWALRRLAAGLEEEPDGFDLNIHDAAASMGLAIRAGRTSPFIRSLGRLCQFDLARACPDISLAIRRKVPPLNLRQLQRLPRPLAALHVSYQKAELSTPAGELLLRRCRRLALSLVELGEDTDAIEGQLNRWRFPPSLSREAAAWARERHSDAATDR